MAIQDVDDLRGMLDTEILAEITRLRTALLEFIHAYANTQQLDHDGTEIELFKAWIRGCAVLGIKAEGHAATRSGAMSTD
jgi:hypothetical protein